LPGIQFLLPYMIHTSFRNPDGEYRSNLLAHHIGQLLQVARDFAPGHPQPGQIAPPHRQIILLQHAEASGFSRNRIIIRAIEKILEEGER